MNKADYLKTFLQDDGKTVILPIDHGTAIPVPGLERPEVLLESVEGFIDGIVANLGMVRALVGSLGDKGVCLRTDVYKPAPAGNFDLGSVLVYGADDAVETGSTAMMNMLYPHHANEAEMLRECASLVSESLQTEIPLIIETLPYGLGRTDDYTVENIGFAVRQAAELGADIVKTAYPGDRDGFARIVDACCVPVVVLGGAASDDAGILRMVAEAMDAGAAGVAIGRNVWQHKDPPKMAKALHAIVHEGAGADAAVGILG